MQAKLCALTWHGFNGKVLTWCIFSLTSDFGFNRFSSDNKKPSIDMSLLGFFVLSHP